ncbi:hypothetical protein MBLNU230_g8513t1 [Neophaeotheca triangularis]
MTQQWSQSSMAEDWPTSLPDHSAMTQPYEGSWWAHESALDPCAMGSMNWLNMPTHGSSVDLGLSPVLSYESRSPHTLNSSESDLPLNSAGPDFSFSTAGSVWPQTQAAGSYAPQGFQQPLSGTSSVSSQAPHSQADQSHTYQPSWNTTQDVPYGAPVLQAPCPQGMPFQRITFARQPVVYQRPLLPRTEGPAGSSHPAGTAPQRMLLPHTSGYSSYAPSITENRLSVSQGYQLSARTPAQAFARSDSSAETVYDSTAEDFSAFIQFDPEEQPLSPTASSHPDAKGAGNTSHDALDSLVDVEPTGFGYRAERVPKASGPIVTASVSSDIDEGRYRNHPLYSKGPSSDGLFYCPWKDEPEKCQHKPTKLKCNYDKFIDSHLKPFRCKIESCSKQEFSSTACLLRHEREAHGMHGHGDRPHLCYYPGCERAVPRNGFPRRYNLFDHMKRVHDHKEEPTPSTGSPDATSMEKKAGGRKRKATVSASVEPAAHRQRTVVQAAQAMMPFPDQGNCSQAQVQSQYQQSPVHFQQVSGRQDQHRRGTAISQWNS